MKVFIRADADARIGSGHVMRCLTLADELREHNVQVSFLCCENPGNLILLIEKKGYVVHVLPSEIEPDTDAALTQSLLKREAGPADWIIIDHYMRDISYESELRRAVQQIMVIDDLANREHDCDLLLDQNFHSNQERYKHLVPESCTCLLGTDYALLRPEFRKAREGLRRKYDKVNRLLVFMGGADPSNETSKVLRAIQLLNHPELTVDVVIGASNPHRRDIELLASKIPQTCCHVQVDNMAKLMGSADINVGAGGTTSWERCCLGLASITLIVAENQRMIAENLHERGAVINLGWFQNVTEKMISLTVDSLIQRDSVRKKISLEAQKIVDGKGTGRVVEQMVFGKE